MIMKRIMIAIALVVSMGTAYAQKSDAIVKSVNAAQAACNDPKKATKVATWLKAAKANVDAYKAPAGKGMLGMTREIVNEAMTGIKPISTSTQTIKNLQLVVDEYPSCKYYYSDNALKIIEITNHFVPDALQTALNDYAQAATVDAKGSKAEEIKKGIEAISDLYNEEGACYYNLGNYTKSSESFAKSFQAAAVAPLSRIDTLTMYNAALAADLAGDNETAIKYYTQTLENGYTQKGDTFARLAECQKKVNNLEGAKNTLQQGFITCPGNQNILIGLINLYLDTKDDANKIVDLLKKAQANEPGNASLYYVEGNLYKQLGDRDKAIEAYDRCSKADAKYPYGEIGKAIVYYEEADIIREEAQKEMNDAKYEALVKKFDETLGTSAKYFENGYEITEDKELKKNLAEYLKSIYYRFRDRSEADKAAYEKYNNVAKNGVQ